MLSLKKSASNSEFKKEFNIIPLCVFFHSDFIGLLPFTLFFRIWPFFENSFERFYLCFGNHGFWHWWDQLMIMHKLKALTTLQETILKKIFSLKKTKYKLFDGALHQFKLDYKDDLKWRNGPSKNLSPFTTKLLL